MPPRRAAAAVAAAAAWLVLATVAGCTSPATTPTGQALPAVAGEPSQLDPQTTVPAPTTRPPQPGTADRRTRPTHPAPASSLRGTVVVLDPGHNGANGLHSAVIDRLVPAGFGQLKPCNTTGTASGAGYAEHAFNWDVAQRVRAILLRHGVQVLLTRSTDTGIGPCVNQRAAFGNEHHATLVVAIHADGHVGGHGFHVIEAARPPAGATVAADSHRLAVALHDRFAAESGFTPSTYTGVQGYDRRTDLAGLNLSLRPTAFIECGNMYDRGDALRMQSAAGRQRTAQAIADGILAYLTSR